LVGRLEDDAWPAAMPIKNGATYQIEWPDTGEAAWTSLPSRGSGRPRRRAQVLIEHGCQKQLDLLVDSASKYSAAQK
jgi:hypothetical protein